MSNKFIEYLNDYRIKCDDFFDGSGAKAFFSTFNLDDVMGAYIDALIRHSKGGKRIRACLVSLGYGLVKNDKNAYDVLLPSLSYELFQTGILAHDDIIDNSDYRRFKPSMHKDLGSGHNGVSKSICVGDLGIVAAIEIINMSSFDATIKLRAISHQNKVFSATIAGELKDIEYSYCNTVAEKDILEMYRLKTAQYTVAGPLVLGAVLAGADDEKIKIISDFGEAVGICFQIRDDILGMFGSEAKLGKSITSDMCEGKKTVLVSHFEAVADNEQKKKFYSAYGDENSTSSELETVRKLLVETGCLEYAEMLCKFYTDKANVLINLISDSFESRELLSDFLEYMTSRNN